MTNIKIGDKFDRLTVISEEHLSEHLHEKVYTCKCDCGKTVEVRKAALISGTRKSCGCIHMPDLVGKKFGKLTVTENLGIRKVGNRSSRYWKCICECGNICELPTSSLVRGTTRSCGCIRHPDLIGKRFGRLVVLEYIGKHNGSRLCKCKCDCGNIFYATSGHILSGDTRSCGCLFKDTHNKYSSSDELYLSSIFHGMQQRCYNPNNKKYKDYGGRGIRICDEWLTDRRKFITWSINNGFSTGLSIERIDVNGDYSPTNCRFASMAEQGNNRRNSHLINIDDVTLTLSQWGHLSGIPIQTLFSAVRLGGDNRAVDMIRKHISANTKTAILAKKEHLTPIADSFLTGMNTTRK